MNFQHGEDRTEDIRVMVFKDYPVTLWNVFIDKKNASQPIKLRNIAIAPSGMKFFNCASSIKNTFSHECQFSKQGIKESESNISDLSKCKDGVFNIRVKLIW